MLKCSFFPPIFRGALQALDAAPGLFLQNLRVRCLSLCLYNTRCSPKMFLQWDGAGRNQGFVAPCTTKGEWCQQELQPSMLEVLMSSAAEILHRKQSGDKWSCKYPSCKHPSCGERGVSRVGLKDVPTCSGRSGHMIWCCWLPETPSGPLS